MEKGRALGRSLFFGACHNGATTLVPRQAPLKQGRASGPTVLLYKNSDHRFESILTIELMELLGCSGHNIRPVYVLMSPCFVVVLL